MYYPILLEINQTQEIIEKLDFWLGTRRMAVWKTLTPLQFSIDTKINFELAIELFDLCSKKEISILKPRYILDCPHCEMNVLMVNLSQEIPKETICPYCENKIQVFNDYVAEFFELTQHPGR